MDSSKEYESTHSLQKACPAGNARWLRSHCSGAFWDHIRRAALPAVMLAVAVVLATGCSSTGADSTGNHFRFAEALVAISIYANAFAADAQIAPDIASTSGSATPSLNLRMPAMPGRTLPLASPLLRWVRLRRKSGHSKTAGSSFRNDRLSFTEVRPFASGRL
jgi:hypothetical protein